MTQSDGMSRCGESAGGGAFSSVPRTLDHVMVALAAFISASPSSIHSISGSSESMASVIVVDYWRARSTAFWKSTAASLGANLVENHNGNIHRSEIGWKFDTQKKKIERTGSVSQTPVPFQMNRSSRSITPAHARSKSKQKQIEYQFPFFPFLSFSLCPSLSSSSSSCLSNWNYLSECNDAIPRMRSYASIYL